MINVTRWSPDTCDCVLEYSWDTEVAQEDRVHIPHAVVEQCSVHAGHSHDEVHKRVKEENTHKNKVLAEVATELPSHSKDNDGQTPDLTKIKWSFDSGRKLKVEIVGASDGAKKHVASVLKNKFEREVDVV